MLTSKDMRSLDASRLGRKVDCEGHGMSQNTLWVKLSQVTENHLVVLVSDSLSSSIALLSTQKRL